MKVNGFGIRNRFLPRNQLHWLNLEIVITNWKFGYLLFLHFH